MHILTRSRILAAILVASTSHLLNAQTSTSWATSKFLSVDFDDEYVRVGSNFNAFSFATGVGTDVAFASPNPELHPITTSFDFEVQPTEASTIDAVASAEAAWSISKNNVTGTASLTNTVGGSASVTLTDEAPDLVAVSWATQASSVDLGTPDVDGDIDWTPSVTLGTGGGGIANAKGAFSITDPIVVWVEDITTGIAEPHTLFQFTAEGDSLTQMHWNEPALLDGASGAIVLLPNTGSFLDASAGGTGSFNLELGSDLLPDASRGTVSIAFEDGLITESNATGVFAALAPRQNAPPNTLPAVGSPALINSLTIDNGGLDGQFSVQINTGQQSGVSDFAACSEGVHVEVGAGVDSVQTFSVDPSNREPLAVDASLPTPAERVPRPCFGEIVDNADLLFGSEPATDHELTLLPIDDAPTIDHFARLSLSLQEGHKTLALNRPDQDENTLLSPNTAPGETRRWNAGVRVRENGADNTGIQIFAIGLVDVAAHGETTAAGFTLFSGQTEAITFSVGRVVGEQDSSDVSVQLFVDGIRQADADVAPGVISEVDWNDVELTIEELSGATRFQMHVVGEETSTTILDTTLDGFEFSDAGYRLAVGSRTIDTAGGNDFDNLVLSYQQNGDVNWDTEINGDDVASISEAVMNNVTENVFDTNYDGMVDVMDIQLVEDLVPNKLPGDANFDGSVDFPDFLALSEAFGQDTGLWTRGDFDRDGRVAFTDFLILSQNFGVTTSVAAVPEPATNVVLGILVVALGRLSLAGNSRLSLRERT